MKTWEQLEAENRAANPISTLPDGRTVTDGDPEYEALIVKWTDKDFSDQAPVVPESVEPYQLRIAMIRNNVSIAAVDAVVESYGEEAVTRWEFVTRVRRDHPLVTAVGSQLSLTESEIDQIFIDAAAINGE